METTGEIRDIYRDMGGDLVVSLRVSGNVEEVNKYLDKRLRVSIREYKQKRTLTQNAYYWTLLTELATKMKISVARLHNLFLRDIAPPFIMDGKIVMMPIPDTDAAEGEALESMTFHIKPTSGIIQGNDGAVYRWYIVLRGSSTFTRQEMAVLLDRLIEECKGAGIETLPPQEIERLQHGKERERQGSER